MSHKFLKLKNQLLRLSLPSQLFYLCDIQFKHTKHRHVRLDLENRMDTWFDLPTLYTTQAGGSTLPTISDLEEILFSFQRAAWSLCSFVEPMRRREYHCGQEGPRTRSLFQRIWVLCACVYLGTCLKKQSDGIMLIQPHYRCHPCFCGHYPMLRLMETNSNLTVLRERCRH